MIMCGTASAKARSYELPLDIAVNGTLINAGAASYIEDGTAYVPVRALCEAAGARVDWDGEAALIHIGGDDIALFPQSRTAVKNGRNVPLGEEAFIWDGSMYIPIRALCGVMGADVRWLDGYNAVSIAYEKADIKRAYVSGAYTLDQIFWLGRVIEAESAGEPEDGMIAVGNVVMNRVRSDSYPDTIYEVIFDRAGGVQFEPVLNGTIYNDPSAASLRAAKLALSGADAVGKCMYFLDPEKAQSLWITENRQYFTTIGAHDFYL